ncbi:V-type proton ATPase subunit G 1 [Aplysia californica]|uniref:V-type proton ATPase subunit G n=1 Tax=Aplysia californica TaxID=6500 RepID=A0ABM0JWM1_APLCA|nr:V-type proton ATPase subunit G 1 [Aplysia californica]
MAQKTEGIQQLLIAEKKATDRVHEARKRKAARLKTAKKEAEAEITAYKEHREKLYKNAEQAAAGKHGSAETEIAAYTNKQIVELEKNMKMQMQKSMVLVQDPLFDIDISLHENVKLN